MEPEGSSPASGPHS